MKGCHIISTNSKYRAYPAFGGVKCVARLLVERQCRSVVGLHLERGEKRLPFPFTNSSRKILAGRGYSSFAADPYALWEGVAAY